MPNAVGGLTSPPPQACSTEKGPKEERVDLIANNSIKPNATSTKKSDKTKKYSNYTLKAICLTVVISLIAIVGIVVFTIKVVCAFFPSTPVA